MIDEQLILLSWRERVMLVYDLPDLSLVGQSALPGQGWGATHWARYCASDGSDRLYSRPCRRRQTEDIARHT